MSSSWPMRHRPEHVTLVMHRRMMFAMGKQSTSRDQNTPDERRILTPRQAALTAGKYHLLGAVSCVVLWVVFELPSLHFAFVRLGWWLAPWRDLPLPYDRADFTWIHGPLHVVAGTQVAILIAFSITLLLVHGAAFRVTALLHRWLGWPRYWREVSDSISLRTAWVESARRSWWFWVAGSIIWELLTEIAIGLRYAQYPFITDGQPFLLANIATIVLGYCYTSALALRRQVAAVVGPDERRCVKCDYRLRGLQSRLCPECAHPFDPNESPEFRLKWERIDGRGRCRKFVRVMLPFTLLAAPLWMPLVVLSAPRAWLGWIPSSLRPGWGVIYHDPNAFLIRLDAVCRIRHGEELCIVRFRKRKMHHATYVTGCWPNAESFGRHPPEQGTMREVQMAGGRIQTLDRWSIRFVWGSGNFVWLHRPDETYEVDAMLVEDFDGDLSWSEEDPAGRP